VLMLSAGGAVLHSSPVGPAPRALAVDTRTRRVFVANYAAHDVSVLDARTGAALGATSVGIGPGAMVLDERRGRLAVINDGLSASGVGGIGSPTLSVLDAASGRLICTRSLGLPAQPSDAALDERRGHVLIPMLSPDLSHGVLGVFDVRDGQLLQTAPIGLAPGPVAVDDGSGHIFVANSGGYPGTVTALAAADDRVIRTIAVGAQPDALAVDPHIGRAVVVNSASSSVSILATRSGRVIRTIPLAGTPTLIAVAAGDGLALVALTAATPNGLTVHSAVTVLDVSRGVVLRTMSLPDGQAAALAVDEIRGHAFIAGAAMNGAGWLSIVNVPPR
jgi:DNA-binding beta-propeller fold protein YncE